MKMDGRRESSNVDDRRGMSGGKKASMGLGGLVVAALITWALGGNPLDVLQMATGDTYINEQGATYEPSAEEEQLAKFAKQILAGTEDVWTAEFQKYGKTYVPPRLVLFSGAVQSGCGGATSESGPFYCSADECVYLDLSFFSTMRKQFGTAGDFAYAYVIAHEVGHHVQNQLGTLSQAHNQMARFGQGSSTSNQISVRLELQADFYAGVWAFNDNKMFGSLEEGDIDEGLAIAAKIGDDYLQRQSYGRTQPETFTHGTSEQRARWLKKGFSCGDVRQGDTFSPAYNTL